MSVAIIIAKNTNTLQLNFLNGKKRERDVNDFIIYLKKIYSQKKFCAFFKRLV